MLTLQTKPGQSKKGWRDPDSDRNNNIQASDLAVNEENNSSEHRIDSQDEEVNHYNFATFRFMSKYSSA